MMTQKEAEYEEQRTLLEVQLRMLQDENIKLKEALKELNDELDSLADGAYQREMVREIRERLKIKEVLGDE